MAQLVERLTPGQKTPVRVAPALEWQAGMAGGLWQGPPEGQMKPASGVDRVQSSGHGVTGIARSDVRCQGRRNNLCLARVLALQIHPFRTFEISYF